MELEGIIRFFENKTILIIGATGSLAKESFIFERVTPNIAGDISDENFGIKDSILREEMWNEIDIVLNSAATTNFDEGYDIALGINTYGALHVLNFAKKCIKLKVLVHVSTVMQIPADMVVNSMIMAMVAHANKSSQIIFHVCSSMRNPMKLSGLSDFISLYFTQNPWIDRSGKSINVCKLIVFCNIARFQAYMAIRYKLPLKVLWLANLVLFQYYGDMYITLNRKVEVLMRMVDL
uniref:Fatty acyl-CoA reductase n=1 Tax=Quercus lobata TaxID=97700 RepID=A0A7N2MTN6_QUELO